MSEKFRKRLSAKVLAGLLVLSVMVSATGCSGKKSAEKASDKEILIGSIHPLTGSMAYEGKAIVNAQQLAVDEINKTGGVLGGRKLKLVTGDNQGTPDKSTSEAQRLIREGVVALTGTYTSSATQTATQEAEKSKVPFVITIASTTSLMDRGFKYSFRLQPNSDKFCENFLQYIKTIKTDDMKTIAIVHEDSLYGTSISKYISSKIADTGLKLVGDISYAATAATLSAEVTKLQELKPDILLPVGYFQDQSMLAKEMIARNIKFKAIVGVANGAFSDPKFIQNFGDGVNGYMDVNYRYNPNSKNTTALRDAYKTAYNEEIPVHAIYGYESIKVIADALNRAKSDNKEDLRKAIAETDMADHVLPQGNIKFDEKGENVGAAGVLVQIQNGKHVIVYPKEYAEGTIIPMK